MSNAYLQIRETVPQKVEIVVVSKTRTTEEILSIYNLGHRDFGENKVQELCYKRIQLPDDIRWHFIGHLQRNKVKFIAPFIYCIHSIDSVELLKEVVKHAQKFNRRIKVLLQFYIAEEDTKFGMTMPEALHLIEQKDLINSPHIAVSGVMGMATYTKNTRQIRAEFESLKDIFDKLKRDYFSVNDDFKIISMGMSDDYKIAIEEGSNMIRIGSAIFGPRK